MYLIYFPANKKKNPAKIFWINDTQEDMNFKQKFFMLTSNIKLCCFPLYDQYSQIY